MGRLGRQARRIPETAEQSITRRECSLPNSIEMAIWSRWEGAARSSEAFRSVGHQRRQELGSRPPCRRLALRARCALRRGDSLRAGWPSASARPPRRACRRVVMDGNGRARLSRHPFDPQPGDDRDIVSPSASSCCGSTTSLSTRWVPRARSPDPLPSTRASCGCIIGPNGAGKTTYDVITGKTKATSGTVYLRPESRAHEAARVRIAQLGVGRKFQRPPSSTVTPLRDLRARLRRQARRISQPLRRNQPRRGRAHRTGARIHCLKDAAIAAPGSSRTATSNGSRSACSSCRSRRSCSSTNRWPA